MPRSALRTKVLTADLIDRFRTRRRSAARMFFSAERVFATNRLLLIASAPVAAARVRSALAEQRRAASSTVFSDLGRVYLTSRDTDESGQAPGNLAPEKGRGL